MSNKYDPTAGMGDGSIDPILNNDHWEQVAQRSNPRGPAVDQAGEPDYNATYHPPTATSAGAPVPTTLCSASKTPLFPDEAFPKLPPRSR